MKADGVLVKKAKSGILNSKNDYIKRELSLFCNIEKGDLKQNLYFHEMTLSTVVISLFEDLEMILKNEPHELRANPEDGFGINITVEKRFVEAVKVLILYSLKYAASGSVIDIKCSISKIQIYIQGELQIPDGLVFHLQKLICGENIEEGIADRAVNMAAQIIYFSKATLDIEKCCSDSFKWNVSLG